MKTARPIWLISALGVIAATSLLFPMLCAAQSSSKPTRPGYVGAFTQSATNKVGAQVIFANLDSATPFVTWPSGNGSQTTKAYEDENFVVLFFVGNLTGSTETFYLNKKTRQFTVIEVPLLEPSVTGAPIQPRLSHGVLR